LRKDLAEAIAETLVIRAKQLPDERYVSPFGEPHKSRQIEFVTKSDFAMLTKLASRGRFSIRETVLGLCLNQDTCQYATYKCATLRSCGTGTN
jgi:hypothetical protein